MRGFFVKLRGATKHEIAALQNEGAEMQKVNSYQVRQKDWCNLLHKQRKAFLLTKCARLIKL